MAFLTQLDTSTLSNQNISSALLIHTFTNTTRLRKLFIDVFADQIAGNGDYVVYVTRQRSGAGSAYEVGARTTVAVPSGVTAQAFPTIALMCGATDVLKVYLDGLAGDTTTVDTIVDVSEEFVLTDASGNVTFSNTSIATVTTLTNAPSDSTGVTTLLSRIVGTLLEGNHNPQSGDAYAIVNNGTYGNSALKTLIDALPTAASIWAYATRTLSSISALASSIASAVLDATASSYNTSGTIGQKINSASGASGGGSSTYILTVKDINGVALDGVEVWVTSDLAGVSTVASGTTDSAGNVTFYLDPATYYAWCAEGGQNFSNPTTITVV